MKKLTVTKKFHDAEMRMMTANRDHFSEQWQKVMHERNQYRQLAEGLGKLLWNVVTVDSGVRAHVAVVQSGHTCGHCRASSLFAALSAVTGKRPKDWTYWDTTDYV